jgi:2-methylisocitrate lyase-like PEP mutase family enzyme
VPAGGPGGSSPRAGEAPADEGPAADAAVARAQAYLAAGADCTYPILAPPEVLPDLVSRISGPVNAMYRPGGPSLAQLAEIGVARISFGTGLHTRAVESVRQMAAGLAAEANQSQRNGSESTP